MTPRDRPTGSLRSGLKRQPLTQPQPVRYLSGFVRRPDVAILLHPFALRQPSRPDEVVDSVRLDPAEVRQFARRVEDIACPSGKRFLPYSSVLDLKNFIRSRFFFGPGE